MEDLWTTNAGNPIISAGHESPRSESNVTSVAKLNTFDYQGKKKTLASRCVFWYFYVGFVGFFVK